MNRHRPYVRGLVLVGVFLAGAVTGSIALGTYWFMSHSETEVWRTTRVLRSDTGIELPAGTELIFTGWQAEGFAALELGINLEGEALEQVSRRTDPRSFLRIPYFVYLDGR